MKVLFLSRWFPYPADNGSKIRISALIKYLAERHEVHLLSYASERVPEDHIQEMLAYCQRVEVIPYRSFQPNNWRALLGFLSPLPRAVVDTYSLEMKRKVEMSVRQVSYDLVIASQIDMAPYALLLQNVPKVFEELELTLMYEKYVKQRELMMRLRNGLTWWKWSNHAARLLSEFDACSVVSEEEKQRVKQIHPAYSRVAVIPNGIEVEHYQGDFGPLEEGSLIFSGSITYGANLDAIQYFLAEIYPLIRSERPDVKLYITGKNDGVPIDKLSELEGVVFTGFLDDIRPRVARSWINIVPLRRGGGTRLKVLESLALSTPVVATSKGVEGLELVADRDYLLADDPQTFAGQIIHLLNDKGLRATLSQNGCRTVALKYNWRTIGPMFCDFVETVSRAERIAG